MYHKIIAVGNLGRDPEMRYTPSGKEVTSFSFATSEKWTGADGQIQEETIWWKTTVWGKSAVNCNQYLKKGSKVLVEGRLKPDPKTGAPKIWTRSDGTPGTSYDLTAQVVKFLSSRGDVVTGEVHGDAPEPEANVESPSDGPEL